MEEVTGSDTLPQTGVNDCLYHLPQCIHQAYTPGVGVDIGNEE